MQELEQRRSGCQIQDQGRLTADTRFQGKGLGSTLLADAFQILRLVPLDVVALRGRHACGARLFGDL